MADKIKQLAKTVVTSFDVQIVDMHLRQKQMKEAISAKILPTTNFTTADATVSTTSIVTLKGITTVLVISCWSAIALSLTQGTSTIVVPCTGLFIFYGAIDQVDIIGTNATGVRLSYLYA